MAKTTILKGPDLFGCTAVDNRFITDYMPDAPGGAVKVYLYALMMLTNNEQDCADLVSALRISEQQLREALLYWEKAGLVNVAEGENGDIAVRFISLPRGAATDSVRYNAAKYSGLVMKLRQVVGTRSLSGAELQKIFDWVEVFGFEEDAAVEIVRHCLGVKGARVHINYMDSVAKRLAADGTLTCDAVLENFRIELEMSGGAAAILKRWHISRRPTEDEIALYAKWTHEWNFTPEAIDLALSEMVAVSSPSFKYLDAILKSYHENGQISEEGIRESIREENTIADLASQAFIRMGLKRKANSADRQQFAFWYRNFGMSAELILYAAELASEKNSPFAEMKKLVTDWHARGIASYEAAKADHEKNAASPAASVKKGRTVSRALNYKQKRYTAEELKKMGVDLGEDVYDEDED